ncbi:MAG: hypothetical protein HGA80_04795 [Candidatus Omnitrophica bacterium]|nr:hypothetical protein [Candidatus Omnitrophota bacterium]
MKSFKDRSQQLLRSDWLIAAGIVVIFLITNRYIFGWDDQHLEIPLLKHLIDPTLYQGDYYVESLKQNFTSFLYPLLAHLIKVDMIPAVYLLLYLVARWVFFFWVFRLWKFLSGGNRAAAFFCTLSIFLLGRTEEFIYRTFSHQEFSYMFVFAGFYFFYRGRYLVSAVLLGLGANFHALYSLFPMMYLSAFILLFQKERKWSLFFKTAAGFTVAALPFIIWTFARAIQTRLNAAPQVYANWMELYLLSCPQNFLFGVKPFKEVLASLPTILEGLHNYIFMAVLYCFHLATNPDLRRDKKTHALALVVLAMTVATFFFTYIVPSHFVLDLNLVRNEQYIRFMLSGYTVWLLWKDLDGPVWKALLLSLVLALSGGKELSDVAVVALIGLVLIGAEAAARPADGRNFARGTLAAIFIGVIILYWQILLTALAQQGEILASSCRSGWLSGVGTLLLTPKLGRGYWVVLLLAVLVAGLVAVRKQPVLKKRLSHLFVVIPFAVAFVFYCFLHYTFVQISTRGGGFWQLQRNWEAMQHYVKEHTPKDALIMVPNDMEMGGFRIHSDRKILVDYRDCGIVGFDLGATVEWQQRMKDIEAFKVIIKEPFTQALMNGIVKYKVDYIVFMRYAAPPSNPLLTKLFENEAFALYKVNRNN